MDGSGYTVLMLYDIQVLCRSADRGAFSCEGGITMKKKYICIVAVAVLSAVLAAGCSPAGDNENGTECVADTMETERENTSADASVEASADEIQESSLEGRFLWLLDTNVEWTDAKREEFSELCRDRYIWAQPVEFISLPESGYEERIKLVLESKDSSVPVYFSTHDKGMMEWLKAEGVIDVYYNLAEENPFWDSQEDEWMVSEQVMGRLGRYFAMDLPKQQEEVPFDALPEAVFHLTEMGEFIISPDMTNYIDSVDERHFTYRGGNEEWEFEYKVDSSITSYKIDGKLSRKSKCNNQLTARYIKDGDGLNHVNKLEITYESLSRGGSLMTEHPGNETVFTISGGSRGGTIEDGTNTVFVTVSLDGETQTFELVNEETVP